MSMMSRYSKEQIAGMSKEKFMSKADYHAILHESPCRFEVACLIRESTNHADQQKAFETQKNMILRMIEETPHFHMMESNVFEEVVSGLKTEKREAFRLMRERANEHKFDILIVDAVSRLARNVKDLMIVIDDLKELGIGILVVKGEYWTYNITYNDILKLSIEGGLAQAESMQTSERVKSHMGELAKKQLLGGDLFGYRLKKEVDRSKNTLEQEPSEAYTVKLIFEKYCSDNPEEALTSSSLCQYLIENRHFTFKGDLKWTPSKVIRILDNTKYMGYQLPSKSEVIDPVKKKKVLTHVEPIRNEYDEEGNLVKGNLVKGNWEPIVPEELWWKAHGRKEGRSTAGTEEVRGRKSGRKVSNNAYARKMFCSCGYALSRQYVHVAKNGREAQYRYKCRWQIINMSKYTEEATRLMGGVVCENPAVSEMKVWLGSKYVFKYLFKNGRAAVLRALELIGQCRQEERKLVDGTDISGLEAEREKLAKRKKEFAAMKADGELTADEYREYRAEIEKRMEEIDRAVLTYEEEKDEQEKKLFDLGKIEERLNTFIDFKGEKISSEMIDMFVERVIYRGDRNGSDEFLWVMNLSGDSVDTSAKYHISGYSKKYADSLKDDGNFNIVANFIIPLEECRKYCEEVVGRRYVPRYWKPITVKVAVATE